MLYFVLFTALIVSAGSHKITVKGKFHCGKSSNATVFMELSEKDVFVEDLLNWKLVSANGEFEIHGEDDEYFSIQPYLRIRHNCNEEQMEQFYDFGRRKGEEVVDMGDIELQREYQ
ncbi:unnamed protein product [Cylicocyclus nassatus]|uniref:Transthyretin-like family protein n=1 Tax=Cylicocyclus nassatus TaxID=53992 RepID=A0AA36MDJ2_CYLNA|nr:unnamed protein product [Cylicocyclus nassatus]